MSTPVADVVEEAHRVLRAIDEANVPARALGGVAVALHEHTPLPPTLLRQYADIDMVVGRGREGDLGRVLALEGYEPDRRFNALYGYKRQLYWDRANDRQLDVFVGRFAMCHELPLEGRLDDPSGTLRPADLLLSKLQVVELNAKDVVDALALLDQHETGAEREGDVIGLDRIAAVTGADWGWHTTASDTLDRLSEASRGFDEERSSRLWARIGEIRDAVAAAPKSMRWRARARVGRRIPWYEIPEEHVR
jgi:hypothetical protein